MMWLPIVLSVSAKAPSCIVQSDNRDTAMTRTSFASAERTTFTHKVYNCYGKGHGKPAILAVACKECEVAVWLDSDIVVKSVFTPKVVTNLLKSVGSNVLVAGVDYYETIQSVRKRPDFIYSKNFNTGALILNCSTAEDILLQWQHYSKNFESDQQALQLLADQNSIFHRRIQYDFMVLGVHSAFMRHFPGAYRNRFPKNNSAKFTAKLPCPL